MCKNGQAFRLFTGSNKHERRGSGGVGGNGDGSGDTPSSGLWTIFALVKTHSKNDLNRRTICYCWDLSSCVCPLTIFTQTPSLYFEPLSSEGKNNTFYDGLSHSNAGAKYNLTRSVVTTCTYVVTSVTYVVLFHIHTLTHIICIYNIV